MNASEQEELSSLVRPIVDAFCEHCIHKGPSGKCGNKAFCNLKRIRELLNEPGIIEVRGFDNEQD